MLKIGMLDPSLQDNNGTVSTNIGDIIIYDAVRKVLDKTFYAYDLVRVSTHSNPDIKQLKQLKECDYRIIGGTNLLSSDIKTYNQWKFERTLLDKILYPIKNVIALGVGWWQYQDNPNEQTQNYYRNILSVKKYLHAVRDEYTRTKMFSMGFENTINTTCPTLWDLSGVNTNRKSSNIYEAVFTLTDYNIAIENDSKLIEVLFNNFSKKLYFFAQGSKDIEYIKSLQIYKRNRDKIQILTTLDEYNELLQSKSVVYVGTRLHAGARALQNQIDTLVLEVDNRTKEISRDTNFPSIERNDFNLLQQWIDGNRIFQNMNIPQKNIESWISQFKHIKHSESYENA